jgi:hypothetical protein
MVPRAKPRSYYGRAVLNEPVWTWEIPCYFFTGGLAGASATLGLAADVAGNEALARRAWGVALAAVATSPPLLISDLGRPERFLNMLRMVKVTSPMSVGTWVLSASGSLIAAASAHALLGRLPRVGPVAKLGAGSLGPALCTYTAVLVADTAVPVWHEARRELPFVFAGSAMASAGAAATLFTAPRSAGPARRLAVLGAALELGATEAMERRLGELAEVYHEGKARPYARAAKALGGLGAATVALAGRRTRTAAAVGALVVLAGSLLERLAVYHAGFESARDPKYTVGPQRRRADARAGSVAAG